MDGKTSTRKEKDPMIPAIMPWYTKRLHFILMEKDST